MIPCFSIVKTEEDLSRFASILANNLPLYSMEDAKRKASWFYLCNPNGAEMFLMATEDGVPFGTKGYAMRDFRCNGQVLRGVASSDIAINESYRSPKMALLLNKETMAMLPSRVDFHFTSPNKNSTAIFKRRNSGFKNVRDFVRYIKILDTKVVLERKISSKRIVKLLGTPFNIFWQSILLLRRGIRLSYKNIHNIENFFPSLSPVKRRTFSGICDSEYIKWRFLDNPFREYKMVAIKTSRGCEGVVIFYEKERRAHISYLICDVDKKEEIEVLLRGFEEKCIKEKYTAIVFNCIPNIPCLLALKSMWYMEHQHTAELWVSDHLNVDFSDFMLFVGDMDRD